MSQETKAATVDELPATTPHGNGNGDAEKAADNRGRLREGPNLIRGKSWPILAFRDGNFGVRLPANWIGIDGRIADGFQPDDRSRRAHLQRDGAAERRRSARKAG